MELKLTVSVQPLSTLDIRIDGQPLGGGGVSMIASSVTLGTGSNPTLYRGRVTGLEGTDVAASVRGPQGRLSLVAQLQIDPRSGAVTGAVSARPGERSGEGREGGE